MGTPFIATSNNTVNISIGSDTDRIKKFTYRNNMLNDNFYKQVEIELGNVYSKAMELGLISQIDDTNNLFRMVIEEISKVYDSGVTRTFDESEAIQEDMTILYQDMGLDEILTQSNIYMNSFNDCLLQVGVKEDDFNVKLRRPDNTIVVTNDDLELEAVYVYTGEDNNLQTWYGYTNEDMFKVEVTRSEDVLNEDNLRYPQDSMDTMNNTLGFIPFVSIHNGFRDDSFWQMYKGDDLVKGTIQVAIKLTFLNHLIKMQSFKQLVASGSNLQQLDGAVIDPQTILFLEGQDTSITTLDLESNYKALWETIQSINNNIALNYKISPNMFRMTGSISSGFALKMENLRLDGFISKQQSRYKGIETRLFDMLKRVDDSLSLGKIKSDKVSVSFPINQYPMQESEELDNQEKEINLGLTNAVDIIMEGKGITEDEAIEEYEENIKYRNQSNEQLNKPTLPEDSTALALGIKV